MNGKHLHKYTSAQRGRGIEAVPHFHSVGPAVAQDGRVAPPRSRSLGEQQRGGGWSRVTVRRDQHGPTPWLQRDWLETACDRPPPHCRAAALLAAGASRTRLRTAVRWNGRAAPPRSCVPVVRMRYICANVFHACI